MCHTVSTTTDQWHRNQRVPAPAEETPRAQLHCAFRLIELHFLVGVQARAPGSFGAPLGRMKHWLTGSFLGWLLLSCLLLLSLLFSSDEEGAWGLVWRWLG